MTSLLPSDERFPERPPDHGRCLLLELPRELRDNIYRWVLVSPTGLWWHDPPERLILPAYRRSSEDYGPVWNADSFALGHTCKQLYNEALRALYECEHIMFTNMSLRSVRDLTDMPLRLFLSPNPCNVTVVTQKTSVLDQITHLLRVQHIRSIHSYNHIEILEPGITTRSAISSEEMVRLAHILRSHGRSSTLKLTGSFWPYVLRDWRIMK